MQTTDNQGKHLAYCTVYPDGYEPSKTYPIIFLLHGFGASMYDLAGLSYVISTTDYIYICPNAPISVDLGNGFDGYAWTEPRTQDVQQFIDAEQKLSGFFEEIMENHSAFQGNCLLAGFSQGGSMTYRYGLPRPDIFSGLVALSCSIQNPDELAKQLPEKRNQSIFIGHGLRDGIERARSSRDFLESEGYVPTYKEYDMRHEITQEVMNDLVPWIHRILGGTN